MSCLSAPPEGLKMLDENSKGIRQAIRNFHIYMKLPVEYFKSPAENKELYNVWKCMQGCSKIEINFQIIVLLFQHRDSVVGMIKEIMEVIKTVVFIKCFIPPNP